MTSLPLPDIVHDVVVVGGGVVGCAVLRELARYELTLLLLEKESDLAEGVTKANSGVIHAGFNVPPGTLKAKTNVEGLGRIYRLAGELGVPHRKTGKLVLAVDDAGRPGPRGAQGPGRPQRRARSHPRRRRRNPVAGASRPRPVGAFLPLDGDHFSL